MTKDHHIPCFLLSRFSAEPQKRRKAPLWQFRLGGAHPDRAIRADNIAYAEDYDTGQRNPEGVPDLPRIESVHARLLATLPQGRVPRDSCNALAQMVRLIVTRSNVAREWVVERLRLVHHMISAECCAALDHHTEFLASSDEISEAELRLIGFEPLAARILMRTAGDEGYLAARLRPKVAEDARRYIDNRLGRLAGELGGAAAKDGQLQVVQRVAAGATDDVGLWANLADADWSVHHSGVTPLVLGDVCVVAVSKDKCFGSLQVFQSELAHVYLPISRSAYLVATWASGPSALQILSPLQLNTVSACLSRKYFYASRASEYENKLSALIGAMPLVPLQNDLGQCVWDLVPGSN